MNANAPDQGDAGLLGTSRCAGPAWSCPGCGHQNPPDSGKAVHCAACGWTQLPAVPPSLPDGLSHPQPKKPSLVELSPWTNPAAYVALPLAALGAGILKLPIAAFVGAIIVLGALVMFGVAFALAATVQFLIRPADGQKMSWGRAALNVLCLLGLFGAVLFAVSPLFGIGGIRGESAPVEGGRVVLAMLYATLAATGLASVALKVQGLFSQRWWLVTAYWSCFVPAAAFVAQHLSHLAWHSRN